MDVIEACSPLRKKASVCVSMERLTTPLLSRVLQQSVLRQELHFEAEIFDHDDRSHDMLSVAVLNGMNIPHFMMNVVHSHRTFIWCIFGAKKGCLPNR